MATPRTLPSDDGTDDARLGPLAASTLPLTDDLTSLVIDLTGNLQRPACEQPSTSEQQPMSEQQPASEEQPAREQPVCRDLMPEELVHTARIHASQLANGFFVRFGTRFLAAYHGTFVAGPAATALTVGPVGAPRGFVVGTWDNPRHYRWLLRNAGPLVRSGLVALTLRPGLAYDLLRTRGRRYARGVLRLLRRRVASGSVTPGAPGDRASGDGASGDGASTIPPVVAVLTHVAVAPAAQGTGLGRQLVEAFVANAREHGADEVRLIAHVATSAPGFYRRLGWSSLGVRTASDATMVEEFQLVP